MTGWYDDAFRPMHILAGVQATLFGNVARLRVLGQPRPATNGQLTGAPLITTTGTILATATFPT